MKKAKKVNFQLIMENKAPQMYALLRELVSEVHTELRQAAIALAWRTETKADTDGKLILGRCVKIGDLQRELADWNFVIVLNKEMWQVFKPEQQRALLDHELSHADVRHDSHGEPMRDERDRVIYRIRKHDIEEFQGVVQRNGCYKRDLEKFAAAIMAKNRAPLLNQPEKVPAEARVN
ncbi:MAG: putative metallopeptidase [Candidatus Binatia bacterium]|nr:putative metallopeptidase [Candidatus Binatia bacterium]